eukprot:s8075_g1.t1
MEPICKALPSNIDNVETQVQKAVRLAAAANKVAAAEKKQGVKTVAKGSKVKTAGKGRGRGRGRGRGSTVEPEEEAKASEQEAEEPSIADDPSPKVTAKAKAKAKAQTRAPPVHAAAVTGINPGTTWVLKEDELKRAGIPIPDGFDGSGKSYNLSAAKYNPATPDGGSISVL